MCLVPNFEMSLWNAWIFMLYHQLLCIVLLGSKGLLIKSSAATPHKKTRRKVVTFLGLIYYLALIYSIFLPLKLGTTWFYIGLPIALSGLIMYTIVTVNFASSVSHRIFDVYRCEYSFGFMDLSIVFNCIRSFFAQFCKF